MRLLALVLLAASLFTQTLPAQRSLADQAEAALDAMSEDSPVADRLEQLGIRAIGHLTYDLEIARTSCDELLEAARQAEDPLHEVLGLVIDAFIRFETDALSTALDTLARADEIDWEPSDPFVVAHLYALRTRIEASARQWGPAVDSLDGAIQSAEASGDPLMEFKAAMVLAQFLDSAQIDYDASLEFERSMSRVEATGSEEARLWARTTVLMDADRSGRDSESEYDEIREQAVAFGMRSLITRIDSHRAERMHYEQRTDQAIGHAERMLETARLRHSKLSMALAHMLLGQLHRESEQPEIADRELGIARELANELGHLALIAQVILEQKALAENLGDPNRALELEREVQELIPRLAFIDKRDRERLLRMRNKRIDKLDAEVEAESIAAIRLTAANERRTETILWVAGIGLPTLTLLAFLCWQGHRRTRRAYDLLQAESERALRAESEKKQMLDHVHQLERIESLGLLAAGVAHDFNNILSTIATYAELIRDDQGSAVEGEVTEIQQSVERASGLCEKLMDYATPKKRATQRTYLPDALRDSETLLRAAVNGRPLTVTTQDDDRLHAAVDRIGLQQVLVNLVSNAAEACQPEDSIDVKLSYASDAPSSEGWERFGEPAAAEHHAILQVTDRGHGIDTEQLRRIFDPFFTTKFEGRGLGLSASFGILAAHEGAIDVKSARGAGTTFRVILPIQAVSLIPTPENPAPAQGSTPDPLVGRVLVVDDESSLGRALTRVFRRAGCDCDHFADGEEAIAQVRSGDSYDVALIDMSMPKTSGPETVRALLEQNPDLRIVMMSGHDDALVRNRLGDLSVDRFLQKPFTNDQALSLVRELLQDRGATRSKHGI